MANSYIRASTELAFQLQNCILGICFFAAYILLCRAAVAFGNFHVCFWRGPTGQIQFVLKFVVSFHSTKNNPDLIPRTLESLKCTLFPLTHK